MKKSVFRIAACIILGVLSLTLPALSIDEPGTIYVVHAIDTETRLTDDKYSPDLNVIDFRDSGSVGLAMTDQFRAGFTDSFGNSVVFTWFALTHPAYDRYAQPAVDIVFDQLMPYSEPIERWGDLLAWHYHAADWSPSADETKTGTWEQVRTFNGTHYYSSSDVEMAERMLAFLILERGFYPTVFRSGWIWENNDFSLWLDDVIPFDFSNAAPLSASGSEEDSYSSGKMYDWSHAPADWSYYHPDSSDYQEPGNLKRTIFRCLPGHRALDLDLNKAFSRAARGQDVLICYYTHSFNSLGKLCRIVGNGLDNSVYVGRISYRYVNALEGAQLMLGANDTIPPTLSVIRSGDTCVVSSNEQLFSFPFGASKDSDGSYARVRPSRERPRVSNGRFEWTFDLRDRPYVAFAVGCADAAGNASVVKLK